MQVNRWLVTVVYPITKMKHVHRVTHIPCSRKISFLTIEFLVFVLHFFAHEIFNHLMSNDRRRNLFIAKHFFIVIIIIFFSFAC